MLWFLQDYTWALPVPMYKRCPPPKNNNNLDHSMTCRPTAAGKNKRLKPGRDKQRTRRSRIPPPGGCRRNIWEGRKLFMGEGRRTKHCRGTFGCWDGCHWLLGSWTFLCGPWSQSCTVGKNCLLVCKHNKKTVQSIKKDSAAKMKASRQNACFGNS